LRIEFRPLDSDKSLRYPKKETRSLKSNALLDLLGWAEAAVFVLAALATAIYVIAKVITSAIRCGSTSNALALIAAAVIFLLFWGGLTFAGVVATIMAVVSDVQAAPAGHEQWRYLSVLGCAAAVMAGVGWVATWLARRVCDAATGRRVA
jgi:hypothetical protein